MMELSAVKATVMIVMGVGFCIEVAEEFTRPTVDAYNNTVPWRVAGGHDQSRALFGPIPVVFPR